MRGPASRSSADRRAAASGGGGLGLERGLGCGGLGSGLGRGGGLGRAGARGGGPGGRPGAGPTVHTSRTDALAGLVFLCMPSTGAPQKGGSPVGASAPRYWAVQPERACGTLMGHQQAQPALRLWLQADRWCVRGSGAALYTAGSRQSYTGCMPRHACRLLAAKRCPARQSAVQPLTTDRM